MTRRGRGLLAFGILVLAGCAVHETGEEYPVGFEIPASYSVVSHGQGPAGRWWETFGDDGLNLLMEDALEENPGLLQIWSRFRQAESAARQARSSLYPDITFDAGASRARTAAPAGFGPGSQEVTIDLFGVAAAATYEVDLWKGLYSRREAARLAAEASREDVETAAVSLTAAAADLWFSLAEQYAQTSLLEEQVKVGETFLELLELRFSLGQSTALDLYQQRQQLAATRSNIPLVEQRKKALIHQIAALAGMPPDGPFKRPAGDLPDPPPLPDPGVPADLLNNRPDVRAALLRIKAADSSIGAAAADLLPSLRLSVRAGFQGGEIEDTFSNFIYQLAAGLLGPVFDGGRRREEVEKRREILEERLQFYRERVLIALRDVEDALSGEDRQRAYLRDLELQEDLAGATLEQARYRYAAGLSDYLPVLTALQVQQRIQRSRLTARRGLLSYRVGLFRALGGDWTAELDPPTRTSLSEEKGE